MLFIMEPERIFWVLFNGKFEEFQWGKMQAYGLGLELKSFIGDLCSPEYDPEEVEYYSSSASRCKKTTEVRFLLLLVFEFLQT